jgi:hypothetical protein
MDMGMSLEGLPPGVQNAEKADLGTEVFRVGGNLKQSFRTGAEEQVVQQALVLQNEWRQGMRQREDHVKLAAESGSSTVLDSSQHFEVRPG